MNKEGNIQEGFTAHNIDTLKIAPHEEMLDFLKYGIIFLLVICAISISLYSSAINANLTFIISLLLLLFSTALYSWTFVHDKLVRIRARNFLSSGRIKLNWYYNENEWARLRRKEWKKEKSHLLASFISSFVLFGIIGFVSHLISITIKEESIIMRESIYFGILYGFIIAIPMVLASLLSARKHKHSEVGRFVAIGEEELFFHGDYFASNRNKWLCNGRIAETRPAKIVFNIDSTISDFVGEIHEEWSAVIPYKMLGEVKAFLDQKNELSPTNAGQKYENIVSHLDPYNPEA